MIIAFPSANPEDQAIGARLRKWRENRKVTIGELAAALGVTMQDISSAERGRTHLNSTQIYAATFFLRIPMRLLFEDSRIE